MKNSPAVRAIAVAALLCSCAALAQPFKCTGPDGKVVYGDSRCEGPAAAPAAVPAAAKALGRYELSDADRERIRELEVVVAKADSFAEQKTAAQLEIQNIRRGADARLTQVERQKRDAFTADVASADVKKRAAAMRELREIYAK